jgi:2,5-furandicarboxylate decarboxylase 1
MDGLAERLRAKNVIACAFACHHDLKLVVVVDDDIDIDEPEQVEWAIATRFEADRDLVTLPGALGSKLDPSTRGHGLGAKLGLDATAYKGDPQRFDVSRVPRPAGLDPDRVQDGRQPFRDYLGG